MILGISFDTPADNGAFRNKFNFPFDLLSDESREVGLAYGAADAADAGYAKRISYIIGADGTIEQVYASVEPAEHPEQVLRDLG